MDKCTICGGELADGKCDSCEKMAKIADKMVKEKMDALKEAPVDKTVGAKEGVEMGKSERMNSLMRAVVNKDVQEARQYAEQRKHFTGSGFLIPTEYATDIYTLLEGYGIARRYCRIHQIGTDAAVLPKLTAGFTMSWIGSDAHSDGTPGTDWASGKRKPVTKPTAAKVDIAIRDVAGVFPVTKATVEDTNTNFNQLIAPLFARAAAYAEDNALINGIAYGGSISVGGLLSSASAVPATGPGFSNSIIADLMDMQSELSDVALDGAVYLMHPSVKVHYRKLELATNRSGLPDMSDVLGYPVVTSNLMPAMGDSAVSTPFVVLGNMSNIYLADRQQLSIDLASEATIYDSSGAVQHALYQDNMIGFRAVERIDIKIMEDSAFAALTTTGS